MHPKEFKKVKNGTGHLTHLSLKNSKLFIGTDFTNHKEINKTISTCNCYILYPSKDAINISKQSLFEDKSTDTNKERVIFLIDSTWSCSLKMLRDSKNLKQLKHISFETIKPSEFKIKQQPQEYCLSTIESTLSVLEILNEQGIEDIDKKSIEGFLNPFYNMIEYQVKCIENPLSNAVRYRKRDNFNFRQQ
ncbi:MAG: hypothetical protein A2513_03835 [Sulfurimonas sp. RIFOXYD12_FULL_33_39]|nr:MAG: hypothetical protein A3G74_09355 [Sulfurimonas sp. RIFCSPLOWO2_12_FULL_34_6]OHE09540.1 MAG: hypothetical protein A2513_03835 [Sulfurimonas sp. RIFOXYD12_FULL_33_39]OHE13045.1 MAG: hypothetical protein A2530_04970 [Sulfurimonas sp. RIFOXYD2_FULL_34_21]